MSGMEQAVLASIIFNSIGIAFFIGRLSNKVDIIGKRVDELANSSFGTRLTVIETKLQSSPWCEHTHGDKGMNHR